MGLINHSCNNLANSQSPMFIHSLSWIHDIQTAYYFILIYDLFILFSSRMGWWLKSWINMFLSDWWNRLAARKLLSFESGKQVQKEHGYKAVFMPVVERIRLSTSDTWRPRKKRWKDWRSGGDNEESRKYSVTAVPVGLTLYTSQISIHTTFSHSWSRIYSICELKMVHSIND